MERSITWVKHPDYPGYMVSDTGEIYSLNSKSMLKKQLNHSGYQTVKLSKHSLSKTKKVHRLVAEVFLGKSEMTVNHKDAVKTNNNLSNLEYLTPSDNMRHAIEMGLHESGVNRYNAKLSIEQVFSILDQRTQKSTTQLSREFGIDQSTVVRIQNGKRYKKEYQLWLDQGQK